LRDGSAQVSERGARPAAVHEATPAELAGWDARTVDVPGGQVLQSVAWARHRATSGWQPLFLVCPDGRAVLALSRPWPVIGGARAYLPRGPVTAGDPPEAVAARLGAVTAWLAGRGVDVVTTDAELPAASDYGERLDALGFRAVEEVQPARHRLSLALAGVTEADALAGVSKQTRQRIRRAEEAGLIVRTFDAPLPAGSDPAAVDEAGFEPAAAGELDAALRRFHRLVRATGARRGFQLGPLPPFLAWLKAAHAAGHAIYLEVVANEPAGGGRGAGGEAVGGGRGAGGETVAPSGQPPVAAGAPVQVVAGLLLYRQGDRLSTVISGDDAAARSTHPGALHLLRWRAIQLAIREGRAEMDLGGVDVAGARHEPQPGEAMYGLYQHKRSFGAVFVEQVGARERVLRPVHLAVARAASRVLGGFRA
jgi:lipid II:glycine glycyltransferase (peptidoglycan interpeptide bridge formation enzyme)